MAERLRSKLKPQYEESFTYDSTRVVPSGNKLYEKVTILDRLNLDGETFPRGSKFEQCLVNPAGWFIFVRLLSNGRRRLYYAERCHCCGNVMVERD